MRLYSFAQTHALRPYFLIQIWALLLLNIYIIIHACARFFSLGLLQPLQIACAFILFLMCISQIVEWRRTHKKTHICIIYHNLPWWMCKRMKLNRSQPVITSTVMTRGSNNITDNNGIRFRSSSFIRFLTHPFQIRGNWICLIHHFRY